MVSTKEVNNISLPNNQANASWLIAISIINRPRKKYTAATLCNLKGIALGDLSALCARFGRVMTITSFMGPSSAHLSLSRSTIQTSNRSYVRGALVIWSCLQLSTELESALDTSHQDQWFCWPSVSWSSTESRTWAWSPRSSGVSSSHTEGWRASRITVCDGPLPRTDWRSSMLRATSRMQLSGVVSEWSPKSEEQHQQEGKEKKKKKRLKEFNRARFRFSPSSYLKKLLLRPNIKTIQNRW